MIFFWSQKEKKTISLNQRRVAPNQTIPKVKLQTLSA